MYLIFQDIPEGDIGRSQPTITSKRLMTFGSVDVNIEKKIRFNRFQVSGIDEKSDENQGSSQSTEVG